jgi:hypothetical protein
LYHYGKLPVTISVDKQVHHFEAGEYPHNEEQCKYKLSENGGYVASFEPDAQDFCIFAKTRTALMRCCVCRRTRSRAITRTGSMITLEN